MRISIGEIVLRGSIRVSDLRIGVNGPLVIFGIVTSRTLPAWVAKGFSGLRVLLIVEHVHRLLILI
ncbi:Uncharacterised protein [Vibrio cholerae]|nr:Uncharacterised protein [Vibrio cholerae]